MTDPAETLPPQTIRIPPRRLGGEDVLFLEDLGRACRAAGVDVRKALGVPLFRELAKEHRAGRCSLPDLQRAIRNLLVMNPGIGSN